MINAGNGTSTKTYYIVFFALLILTAVTVGAALVDLGGLNHVVALAIAGSKAALVVMFFMHARDGPLLVRVTIAAGCLWLALLIGLTMSDFATRSW